MGVADMGEQVGALRPSRATPRAAHAEEAAPLVDYHERKQPVT